MARTSRALCVFALFLSFVSTSCGFKEEGPPGGEVPPDNLPHESMPTRCSGAPSVTAVHPRGDDPETFLLSYWPNNAVSSTKLASLLTRNGGRTFEKISGLTFDSVTSGEGPRPLVPLYGAIHFLDEGFWLAGSGNGIRGDSGGNGTSVPVHWINMVIGGVPRSALGVSTAAHLPDGIKSDMIWKGDNQHWVARGGSFLYASRNAGAAWTRIGPAPYFVSKEENALFSALAWKEGQAVHLASNNGFLGRVAEPGKPSRLLSWPGRKNKDGSPLVVNVSAAYWGEQLAVTVTSVSADHAQIFVGNDALTEWTELNAGAHVPLFVELHVDNQNRLWAYPTMKSPGESFIVYRWDKGATQPTIIDLHAGIPFSAIDSMISTSDGRVRFTAAPDFEWGRYTNPRMLCEAGPNVTPEFASIVVEPLHAVSSGRVVRIARLQDGSMERHRIAMSPAGKIYASAFQSLIVGPPDMPPLYTSGIAHEDGIPLQPFDATETHVWTTMQKALALNSPPYDHLVQYAGGTGARATSKRLDKPMEVFAIREVLGRKMLHSSEGVFFSDRLKPEANDEPPPKFPRGTVVSARHGIVIEGLDYYRVVNKLKQYAVRFDPLNEPVPDVQICHDKTPTPANCIDISNTLMLDAELDTDGTVYLLDYAYGRVMALAPNASSLVEVAKGFITPSDLLLRGVNGKTAVLVYDGDVFAFTPELGTVKVRGEGEPLSNAKLLFGKRDLNDCMTGAPCIDAPSSPINLSGTPCLTGRDFGAQAGKVFTGSPKDSTITSWTDTKVCFQPPADSVDTQIQLQTQDGAVSNRVPGYAPTRVDSWEIPSPLYIDGTFKAVGHNLNSASVFGAVVVSRADSFLELRPSSGGEQYVMLDRAGQPLAQKLVNAAPRVKYGCRVTVTERCEVLGAGFGQGGTSISNSASLGHTVHVNGVPGTVASWRPERIAFFVPPGTAPGIHTVQLHATHLDLTAQIEVLAVAPEVLLAEGPTPDSLRFANSRPTRIGTQLYVPLMAWSYGTINGIRTPLQLDTLYALPGTGRTDGFDPGHDFPVARAGGLGDPGASVHLIGGSQQGIEVTMLRGSTYTAEVRRLKPSENTALGTFAMPFGSMVRVSGAGMIENRLVAVLSNSLTSSSTVFQAVVGANALESVTSSTLAYSPIVGEGPEARYGGVFVTPGGLYLGTCRKPGSGAQLHFVPVTVGMNGALTFGTMESIVSSATARITACVETETGLAWILRDGTGEHIEQHSAGSGVSRYGTLPLTLPGSFQSWTFSSATEVPGIVDLMKLPNGEFLLAVVEREQAPRGLRLARIASDMGYTLSALVTPSTLAQPGEHCVGPASATCPRLARDGCGPFACAVRPWQRMERPSDVIGNAMILSVGAGDTTATVVFENTATVKTKAAGFGGSEVQLLTLPIP